MKSLQAVHFSAALAQTQLPVLATCICIGVFFVLHKIDLSINGSVADTWDMCIAGKRISVVLAGTHACYTQLFMVCRSGKS